MHSLCPLPSITSLVDVPPEFATLPAPNVQLQACVIIPARDEAKRVEGTLDALAGQLNGDGTPFDPTRYEIVLGCNNCRDNTAARARSWGQRHPHIRLHVVEATYEAEHANVGFARRMLMDSAYTRLTSLPQSVEPRAICSTDADTRAFPHWLSATLAEISAGAEAVGGRIYVEHGTDETTRRTYLLDTAYRLSVARLESIIDPQTCDPWPRHFQFFGASLALTPQAYAQVGGLPRVSCLEDVTLERELLRREIPLRHSPQVAVLTSARSCGRVPMGLSTQLQEWRDLGASHWLVPSGREIAARTQARRHLRHLFGALDQKTTGEEWETLAQCLLMSPHELRDRTHKASHFGELWDDVWALAWGNNELRACWQPVGVETALRELRSMLCNVSEK